MKILLSLLFIGILFVSKTASADIPPEVNKLAKELSDLGGTVRGGASEDLGFYLVGVGRSTYKREAVNKCREAARINAIAEVTAALQRAVKSHDIVGIEMKQTGDQTEVKAFVSSLTESRIDQLMKGVQLVSSGPNANGEMEVVVYLCAKMNDASNLLLDLQSKYGDNGVVVAVGIDASRVAAEQDALRSAVEQVAGTMVVGKVAINEREELHKRLATTAHALVEEYRVVNESKVEEDFRIEVVAHVSKRKLYESYRSFFKCLDNPVFYIDATDGELLRAFSQYFMDKGFMITRNRKEAHYIINLDGRFHDRPTPKDVMANGMGTQLSLTIDVVSVDGSQCLLTMREKQASDSEVWTREQRVEDVSQRIFKKVKGRLDQALHDMVIRMLDDKDTKLVQKSDVGTAL